MGQILSPSEVEAILTGLDFGTVSSIVANPVIASLPTEEISLYDFEHPVPLRPSHLDTLRRASASVSQSLQVGLTGTLHCSVDVNFIGVEQSTYREYLATAEKPSCLAVFETSISTDTWLLDISRSLAFTMIDCLLGGSPAASHPTSTMTRPFTEVETRLIEKTVRAILPHLAGSLSYANSLRMTRMVSDSLQLSESNSNEAVALISFEVAFGLSHGLLQLCVPWKHAACDSRSLRMEAGELQDLMKSGAVKVPVTATASVAHLKLSARDLANLNPGDILLTDTFASTEISLEVGGCEIFRGSPAQIHDRKVIRLTVPANNVPTKIRLVDPS